MTDPHMQDTPPRAANKTRTSATRTERVARGEVTWFLARATTRPAGRNVLSGPKKPPERC